MSGNTIAVLLGQSAVKLPRKSYLDNGYTSRGWLLTGDIPKWTCAMKKHVSARWRATGLQGQIPSRPLTESFVEISIMDHEAYDYEWLTNKIAYEVETVG